jgi:hypothetical protein
LVHEIPLSDLRKQLLVLPTAIPIWSRTASVSSTPSFVAHSGVKDIVRNIQDTTPYKIFNLLFTDELIEHIVFQTNLYASQKEKKITHKFCGDKSFFGTKFTYGDKVVTCL